MHADVRRDAGLGLAAAWCWGYASVVRCRPNRRSLHGRRRVRFGLPQRRSVHGFLRGRGYRPSRLGILPGPTAARPAPISRFASTKPRLIAEAIASVLVLTPIL